MKKKILLFIISILTFMFLSSFMFLAENPKKININYFRFFGKDLTHTAWVWEHEPESKGGKEFIFSVDTKNPKWLFVTVNLDDSSYLGSEKLGVIIKEGKGWDGKREPGGDRHVDLSKCEIIDNTYNVYFVQDSVEFFYKKSDADTNHKVLDSYFTTTNRIIVKASGLPTKYIIKENGANIKEGTTLEKDFEITLNNPINLKNIYEVELIFEENISKKVVSLRKLYDTDEYNNEFYYDGQLGLIFSKTKSTFRLWSPISEKVNLNLYNQGHPNYTNEGIRNEEKTPYRQIEMNKIEKGVHEIVVNEDLGGKYYTFELHYGGNKYEIIDPYAYSTGANGERALIVDFAKANPEGWEYDKRPSNFKNMTDYILYEAHIRDLTSHDSWGGKKEYAGKFLGLTQENTFFEKNGKRVKTGLDHLEELGINAIHLLPIADYGMIDETKLKDQDYIKNNGYNWGYMPINFNTPEGSFSTNPFDGYSRIREMKQMIQALHDKNIRVILDVVYNHTGKTDDSQFQLSMPNYYYRQWDNGSFSNGSGTGNETASERKMFQKFMIDSILYWAKEYNIGGFRFDLMGLHDVETMNIIREKINEIDPTIILYGEPWSASSSPYPSDKLANKENMHKLTEIASFNDNSRDAVKYAWAKGYHNEQQFASIKYAIAGGTKMQGVYIDFHKKPTKIINYVTSHDDGTLVDINLVSNNIEDINKLARFQKQQNAFFLLGQGIPFLAGGVEMMRSKDVKPGIPFGNDNRVSKGKAFNSYNLPDSVNQYDYEDKLNHLDVFEYYKNLIKLRKLLPNLRLENSNLVQEKLSFFKVGKIDLSYRIKGDSKNSEIVVIHNGKEKTLFTADKDYIMLSNNEGKAVYDGIAKMKKGQKYNIDSFTTILLVEDDGLFTYNQNIDYIKSGSNKGVILGITIPLLVIALVAGVVTFIVIKKKK